MANEFKIKNGLYVSGSVTITNNITVSGSLDIVGGITGSLSGSAISASHALDSDTLGGLPSSSFAPAATFNDVSSSYASASGSLSTRVTDLESTASVLTSASASFAVVSSSYESASGSLSTRVTNLESTSSTVSSSFASTSGSIAGRVTLIEGQYATTGSNTFTGAQRITDVSNAIGFTSTASLYTDGGLRVQKDSYVSGTAYFNNVVVYGTSSIQYITSSQVNIGTNIITVNTDTPSVRFGGLAVYDSGSTLLTGSILWDSEKNHWVYANPSGSTYSGGMLISGPRASSLGTEVGTTACAVMIGQGSDHITSSGIFSYANATCFYGQSFISSSGAACFAGSLTGTNATFTGSVNVSGSLVITTTAPELQVGATGVILGNALTDVHQVTGSLRVTGSSNHWFQGGCVGIGTTTPTARLHVGAGNQTPINGADTKIHIADATLGGRSALVTLASDCTGICVEGQFESSAEIYADTRIILGSTSNHPLAIRTNNLERARVFTSGNVSIGRCDDSYRLNVAYDQPKTCTSSRGFLSLTTCEPFASNPFGLVVTVSGGATINNRCVNIGTTDFGLANGGMLILNSAVYAYNGCTVGIGVVPKTSWAGTAGKAMQIGVRGALANSSTYGTLISSNAYYDGSWKYICTGGASALLIDGGNFIWYANSTSGNDGCTITSFDTAKMILNSAGNLGLGISPTTAFNISRTSVSGADVDMPALFIANGCSTQGNGSTSFNQSALTISSGNGTVSSTLRSAYDSAGTYGTGVDLFVTTNHYLRFGTNNTERLRISNCGNVTICTIDNQGGLTVTSAQDNTTVRVGTTATGGQEWRIQSTGGTSGLGQGKLFFKVGTTEAGCNIPLALTTDNGANGARVGIGIVSPEARLHIDSNNASPSTIQILRLLTTRTTNNCYGIELRDSSNEVNAAIYSVQEGANNRGSLVFGTNNGTGGNGLGSTTSQLRIFGSGVSCFSGTVCSPAFVSTGTSRLDSLILTRGTDPQICSSTNVGLNIDGYALYLNRYSNSGVYILENETGSSYGYIGKSWSATNHRINLQVPQGCVVLVVSGYSCVSNDSAIFQAAKGASGNSAAATLRVTCNDSTGRSINAGGSINANGLDYAEYVFKRCDTGCIQKGQIAGIDVCKLLTDKWSLSCSFVVKSTSPSFIGGDEWSLHLGKKPEMKVGDDPELFATCLAEFEVKLEEARQSVDRVAFSGQVPVIISGSYNVGDYVLPIEGPDDTIIGVACPLSSLSLIDYGRTVGKIWGSSLDKVWIAVKMG